MNTPNIIVAKRRLLQIVLAFAITLGTLCCVESWSPSPKNERSIRADTIKKKAVDVRVDVDVDVDTDGDGDGDADADGSMDKAVVSRRKLFEQSATAFAVAMMTAPSETEAACLQGDTRPVCIGIYKVPLDDEILPYISTPEQLRRFAPDLTYVPPIEYPASFESAMAILRTQRSCADEIRQHVMDGKLEEAGVKVLGLLPRVTSGCRRVVADLEAKIRTTGIAGRENTNANVHANANVNANLHAIAAAHADSRESTGANGDSVTVVEAMAIEMAENQMNYVTGCWGDCDVTIGQGIRGELGRLTVAQLTILSSLRDATVALDDFLVTATTLSGSSPETAKTA